MPVSTLRYYDAQGFFPQLERSGGQRLFGPREITTIEVIECLKKSGLSIADIGKFIQWCEEGDATLEDRLALFTGRKYALAAQIAELRKVEAMLNFKVWYYQQATAQGGEDAVRDICVEDLPEWVRVEHQRAHLWHPGEERRTPPGRKGTGYGK